MTTKERLHQIIDEWDDTRTEALLTLLEPYFEATNGHHVPSDWTAFHDQEWLELIRVAHETPPDERTPFQDGLVLQALQEAELVKTPDGRTQLHRNRRDRERIANARPLDDDHPIWDMVGMFSSDEPTDIANHKDEYIADAIEHGWT